LEWNEKLGDEKKGLKRWRMKKKRRRRSRRPMSGEKTKRA
jgi:hypothetical protein